jgi:predicted nucleic acid-binding protein
LTVYVDSSFLVSLYVTDQHSAESRKRVLAASDIWFTPLHLAEWAHAIAQHVFRRKLTPAEAQEMYLQLEADRTTGRWLEAALPEHAFGLCADLARRHGPKLGVRTLDSLHVACALELKAERFWTFDQRQAKLARAEGLKTP